MALDPADVIRRFEPILYFHRDAAFFPSDAKRYLEHCALWDVKGLPRDDKDRWGSIFNRNRPRIPLIPRGKIVVIQDEKPRVPESEDGVAGKFLGQPGQPFFLADTATEERFLDLAGWTDSTNVSSTSVNLHANVDEIASLYNGTNRALTESRFWYHAEVFSADRLRRLAESRPPIYREKIAALKDPALVCYYLFFPASIAGLKGCSDPVVSRFWSSCSGAWACVSVLLAGDGNHNDYAPVMIGVTSRNAGTIDFLGEERRIGMRVSNWSLVTTVTRDRGVDRAPGDHPRIFVALRANSLSLTRESVDAAPFSPVDASQNSCGKFETIEALTQSKANAAGERTDDERLILAKVLAGAADGVAHGWPMGGFIGGALGGALVGLGAALAEFGTQGLIGIPDEDPFAYVGNQRDDPPQLDETGIVIHPKGVLPPEMPADGGREWPRFDGDENDLTTSIDGRDYSLWVASLSRPESRPIWLPSESQDAPGFVGRWGNRVASDPFNRRAGMRFPEFWAMFLDGIGKS